MTALRWMTMSTNRSEIRYTVYGAAHPAFTAEIQGTYRSRTHARLVAWWFRNMRGGLLWPNAWVVTCRVPPTAEIWRSGSS